MFRGNCPTRLDDKGRLKMPAEFKREIDERYDGQFYITSFDGKVIQLYPLSEWEVVEQRMASQPVSNVKVQKFLDVTSYYGQVVALDSQGRLTIAEWLRNKFGLKGEVAVIGKLKHIEIRLMEDFGKQVEENPLTPEDLDELMRQGI
ncbi:MAG: division/cell wall cluster transcriptional repressor MraZ [Acidobacteria bacterium]|nr:MAG: division/cell wall cluster transcriptional repressor MraZ [Acidobacteriota bacterium]